MEKIFIRLENLISALTPTNTKASKAADVALAIVMGTMLALALVSWWTS
jgi:hypothetical protein